MRAGTIQYQDVSRGFLSNRWAHLLVSFAIVMATVRCASLPTGSQQRSAVPPRTRAEATRFRETSRYGDVIAFLDTLQRQGAPIIVQRLGTTTEGRDIPLVIASRPRITSAAAAHRMGRPIVYINANIHAGEVEGKEAALALLRDLSVAARAGHPTVLDSLVLLVVPDYNADGNDRFGPQSVNREEQNGPERVGTRANAMGLDLNRDYVKAEAPETRAALALFRAWDPDVYLDLHTTDGSYHGYALTYAASLSPAAPLGEYTRVLLASVRRRLRTREHMETFDYGNFDSEDGDRDITDSMKTGWYTFDARPRFGTNYVGIRGRVSILSEAFSHDPFERRVASTDKFVRAVLSFVAERASDIRARVRAADAARPARIPLGAVLTAQPRHESVLVERMVHTGDSSTTQPGVPRGIRRTGHVAPQTMPVYDRFDGTTVVTRPAGYLVPAADTAVLHRLAWHGIVATAVESGRRFAAVQSYMVDSVLRAKRPFQGHTTIRVTGHWASGRPLVARDSWVYVSTDQPRGTLAVYLLEPESSDGFVTWNFFDAALAPGRPFPVLRVLP